MHGHHPHSTRRHSLLVAVAVHAGRADGPRVAGTAHEAAVQRLVVPACIDIRYGKVVIK
jgi:hypothetical protein